MKELKVEPAISFLYFQYNFPDTRKFHVPTFLLNFSRLRLALNQDPYKLNRAPFFPSWSGSRSASYQYSQ